MRYYPGRNFFFIFLIAQFFLGNVLSQENDLSGWVSYNSSLSDGNNLPFWFTHNQSGKFISEAKSYQLLESGLRGVYSFGRDFNVKFGLDFDFSFSGNLAARLNQLFIEGELKWLVFKAGSFTDQVLFAGLSSSNGSLTQSLNYRPYPKVMLETNGFIPIPLIQKWFSFKAEYDEGVLLDERIVDRAHLHHKSLLFRYSCKSLNFTLDFGMNHFVFWGGNSPTYGKLPDKLGDYILYVTGQAGNNRFPETDIQNVSGNQLGDYIINFTKSIKNAELKIYFSHPFDDHSGMEFDNLEDNLYGIGYFSNNSNQFIEAFVYEFILTKNQSGAHHIVTGDLPHERGRDNYFNHGVYSSGFTYFGYTMCSPLFFPVVFQDGKTKGIANTRFSAHHLGMKGSLSNKVYWKALLTFSDNSGTYSKPFEPSIKQFSSYFELKYISDKNPFEITLATGVDHGELSGNCVGGMVKFKWIF